MLRKIAPERRSPLVLPTAKSLPNRSRPLLVRNLAIGWFPDRERLPPRAFPSPRPAPPIGCRVWLAGEWGSRRRRLSGACAATQPAMHGARVGVVFAFEATRQPRLFDTDEAKFDQYGEDGNHRQRRHCCEQETNPR